MGTAGFTMPGVLFLGSIDSGVRGYLAHVLPQLRARGYERVIEPCAGSLAVSNLAAHLGFAPSKIEASDVSLFSAVVGAVVSGTPLAALGVAVDGTPIDTEGDPVKVGAHILWRQLVLRMQTKGDVPYWADLIDEAIASQSVQEGQIARSLTALRSRLSGMLYRPMDLFAHMDSVADDPKAIVIASPPTYTAGYERFFDTGGRLTWNEPEYGVFNPGTDQALLYERYAEAKCLTILYEEAEPRRHVCQVPVFAQPMGMAKNNYLGSNRPMELLALTGDRPMINLRTPAGLTPSRYPIIPFDHPVTPSSSIAIEAVGYQIADYYRGFWLHRLTATPGDMNLLLVLDGYAAGVIGFSTKFMAGFRSKAGEFEVDDVVLLRYAAGAPHAHLRLTRLASMVALQRYAAALAAGPKTALYVAASRRLLTVEFTRHPEAKGQRGLMKLINRHKGPEGFRLIYGADWKAEDTPLTDVLAEYLMKEERWRKSSTKRRG